MWHKIWFLLPVLLVAFFVSPIAKAVSLSPSVIDDMSIDPGSLEIRQITVTNNESSAIKLNWEVQEFVASGQEGGQEYVSSGTGVTEWFTLGVESLEMQPGDIQQVDVTVSVPDEAVPGGYYATLFFFNDDEQVEGSGLISMVGIPFLVRVNGDIDENAELYSFSTYDESSFYNRLPVNFLTELRSTEKVHFKPHGSITIKNIFGMTVAVLPANPKEVNVLADSTRNIDSVWQKTVVNDEGGFIPELKNEWHSFALGRFCAHLEMVYGSNDEQLSDKTCFVVFPWRLILTITGAILLFIVFVAGYNSVLIKRAKNKPKKKQKNN